MSLAWVVAAGVCGALVGVALRGRRTRSHGAWEDFAGVHGLAPPAQGPRLAGQLAGLEVELRQEGSELVLRVAVAPWLPEPLALEGGAAARLARQLSEQLGVEAFDAAFALHGLTAEARELLRDGRVQRGLLGLRGQYDRLVVRAGWLEVRRAGQPEGLWEMQDFAEPALALVHLVARTAEQRRARGGREGP